MSDLLEISNYPDKDEEKADIIFCDLVKIKRALDYSIEREMEHEFIYSMIKFARNNPDSKVEEIIDLALSDWKY
jgi:hypothetical protein